MAVAYGGVLGPAEPAAVDPETLPNPARYTATVSPICAGLALVTRE